MTVLVRSFSQHLQSGDWLTRARLRDYSIILLVIYVTFAVVWTSLSVGMIDLYGNPIGTDFSNVYVAGVQTWAGRSVDVYDPYLQHAAEKVLFNNPDVPAYGWHYPPFFLLVAAALAMVPYGWALLIWMAVTFAPYLLVMRAICPGRYTVLVAAAFPAVLVNLGHGQNGFATAALLGGALLLLDRKPLLAGLLIGLLAYKPQFGLLIPLVLLLTGRWRVIASASATVLTLAAITLAVFGKPIWLAFRGSAEFSQTVVLEHGSTGWEKIQSVFSAARMWGASIEVAYAAQGMVILFVAVTIGVLWRSRAAYEFKAAALALGCLLATPYILDYDLMVLAVPLAFLARHGLREGFQPYAISLLALTWLMPLLARMIMATTTIAAGFLTTAALFGFVIFQALRNRDPVSSPTAAVARV